MDQKLVICCTIAVVIAFIAHGVVAVGAFTTRAGLGDKCNNKTANCSVPNSVCNNKTSVCECEVGYEVNKTICTIKLNATCDNSKRICNRTGATCQDGKCTCNPQHVISANGTVCLPLSSAIGQLCETEAQCQNLRNVSCYYHRCSCKIGFFEVSPTNCESRKCRTNFDCGLNSECYQGACKCQIGKVQYSTGCYTKIETLGAKCDESKNEVCWQDYDGNTRSDCKDGKCICAQNYKPDKKNKRCVSFAPSSAMASAGILLLSLALSLRL